MTPEQFIERNIKTFLDKADKGKPFTESTIQRVCKIGYNQACYTVAKMLDDKLAKVSDVKGWNYKYEFTDS